jgi:hypothetical protein
MTGFLGRPLLPVRANVLIEGHHHLLLVCSQIEKDRIPRVRESGSTLFAFKDAPLAALGHIGRNTTYISKVHQVIMITLWIGHGCLQSSGFLMVNPPFF